MSATAGHTPDRQDTDRQAGMQAHTHTHEWAHTHTHTHNEGDKKKDTQLAQVLLATFSHFFFQLNGYCLCCQLIKKEKLILSKNKQKQHWLILRISISPPIKCVQH